MKKIISLILITLLVLNFTGCKEAEEKTDTNTKNEQTENKDDEIESETKKPAESVELIAKNYINDLISGNYSAAYNNYKHDNTMKSTASADFYKSIMTQLNSQLGDFKKYISTEIDTTKPPHTTVMINSRFELSSITINVVFNEENQIAGLNYKPYNEPVAEEDTDTYYTKELSFGTDKYPLKGTLTIPKGVESSPVIIFVHGSGPNDRDETVGPNKPFRDIAIGLANNGIASFRYDKRTNLYPNEFAADKNATVYEETTQDALLAIDKMMSLENVEFSNLYVLGHSLGGYLMPRIAAETDKASGFIMLAGGARNLLDVISYQVDYIYTLDGSISEEEQNTINQIEDQINIIKKGEMDANTPILGAYKPYWNDLLEYEPLELVKEVEEPILFLQGERDYQVTMTDFNLWKDAVESQNKNEFISFEKLNHLMMPGEGKSTPDEYNSPNEVDNKVIEAIVNFIN
ncbi:MAG: DUF3887 domain-containing protein [Eubacteriales bacterium]